MGGDTGAGVDGVGADREGGGKVLDRGAGVLLKKLMSGKAVSKTKDLSL